MIVMLVYVPTGRGRLIALFPQLQKCVSCLGEFFVHGLIVFACAAAQGFAEAAGGGEHGCKGKIAKDTLEGVSSLKGGLQIACRQGLPADRMPADSVSGRGAR